MPSKKSLIVFDIDGTLTDSVSIHQIAFREALQAIGVDSFDDRFHSYIHHTDSHIARVICEKSFADVFTVNQRREFEGRLFERICSAPITEIPGARNFLKHLETESEFGICFATGSLYRPAAYKLDQIGISYDTDLLVASDELEEREKIVERAIDKACSYYRVTGFERIISIGDGLWDLKTAQKLGLEFIGIGASNKQIMMEHGMIHHTIDFRNLKIELVTSEFNTTA